MVMRVLKFKSQEEKLYPIEIALLMRMDATDSTSGTGLGGSVLISGATCYAKQLNLGVGIGFRALVEHLSMGCS